MRWLPFLFGILPILLFAQPRQDTVFTPAGEISRIAHRSRVNTDAMSPSYRFMRGLTAGKTVWVTDSVLVFDERGGTMVYDGDGFSYGPTTNYFTTLYTHFRKASP